MSATYSFLKALFLPHEVIGVYGPRPNYKAYVGPWESAKPAEYVTLNPLAGEVRQAHLMADYRNFLLEFDSVTLDQQRLLLPALEKLIPLRTVTYSGGKSMQAIVSLSDTLISGRDGEIRALMYSDYFRRLRAAATAVLTPLLTETPTGDLIDKANADASRLTRLAGATNRQWKEPSKPHTLQTLESIGGLVSSEQFENFIHEFAPNFSFDSKIFKPEPVYKGTFERTLQNHSHLKGLRSKLLIPETWAGSVGNHPHFYSATMWAIDATGVSQPEFMDYVVRFTAPYVISLGYPMWKIEEAIIGAYKVKQRRTR